jgi:tetratricopeptide (TPR) repeat protein
MKKLLLVLLCVPLIGLGQDWEYYHEKGEEYQLIGEWDKAIDSYTKSLNLLSKINTIIDGDGENMKGFHTSINYYRRGNAYCSKALSLGKDYWSTRLEAFWYQEAPFQLAVSDFTKCIEIWEFDDAYFHRAQARRFLDAGKDIIDFCSDYKKACDLNEKHCKSYYTKCK